MSNLELRQLRAFAALVDRGSFKGAAQALGVAQSTVSEALAALERELGASVVLRRRGSHGLHLTAAGDALLPHARAVLAAAEAARSAVAEAEAAAHTTVAIVANESISTYVLPLVLPRLRERWPRARFPVSVAMCAGVRSGVRGGEFDVGLLLGTRPGRPADGPDASAREDRSAGDGEREVVARRVPLVVFADPGHPLARGAARRVERSAAADYPLILSDAAGDFHALVRGYFESDGVPGPALQPAGSVEAVKRGVFSTPFALGVLPGYALREELQDGRAVAIALDPPPPDMRMEAILGDRVRHPAVGGLLDGLAAQLDGGGAG
jgi:LysR family transcriptional regulator, hydrogen peroxide-inducible genes activator